MLKQIELRYGGAAAQVGGQDLLRVLPNRFVDCIGPFTFLDYFPPRSIKASAPKPPDGSFAHPHRGISTFTYIIEGQIEHYDSRGNHGIVKSGGIQWMKAGNGIVHDEAFPEEFQRSGGILQGLQFWINLPAENKAEEPEYKPIQSDEIPEYKLDQDRGTLRVLIGDYDEHFSLIPVYSQQFLYHIILNPGGVFSFDTEKDMEYAAQFISGEGKVNDADATEPELFVFGEEGSGIHLVNTGASQMDVILFGGEAYTEPIEAGGPFVMNTREELSQAYQDYRKGEYGIINYNN
ncbi:MAG: pirin family protein [Bacteroides sp.]|nr:pirin family protein [Bacteroides sp.]